MRLLTDVKRLERLKKQQELRRKSNEDIKIFNSFFAMKINPYANDTTSLPYSKTDNRGNNSNTVQPQTEDEVLELILNPISHKKGKRNDIRLFPDAVSDDIREYWLNKINSSRLRGALSLRQHSK